MEAPAVILSSRKGETFALMLVATEENKGGEKKWLGVVQKIEHL